MGDRNLPPRPVRGRRRVDHSALAANRRIVESVRLSGLKG
jgi:hypothetical protein